MKRKLQIPLATLFIELYEIEDVKAVHALKKRYKLKKSAALIRKLLRDAVAQK